MKQLGLTIIVSLVTVCSYAQADNANMILSENQESQLLYHSHDPPLRITADYISVDEAVNLYPEQLIQSILSARDQEWVDYNTLGGAEKSTQKEQSHFDQIASMNKDSNYFELYNKLTFDVGGTPTAMIKFLFKQEGQKLVSGCFMMQQINGRWYKTSIPSFSTLSIMIMRLKTEALEAAILGNSNDPGLAQFAERVTTDGSLDFEKMEQEFVSWYSPSIDQEKIDLLKDPKAW